VFALVAHEEQEGPEAVAPGVLVPVVVQDPDEAARTLHVELDRLLVRQFGELGGDPVVLGPQHRLALLQLVQLPGGLGVVQVALDDQAEQALAALVNLVQFTLQPPLILQQLVALRDGGLDRPLLGCRVAVELEQLK
jgi:hypothetical protein